MDRNEFNLRVDQMRKQAGLGDYELYYASEESTEVEMFNGETTGFTSSLTGGAAFRCIVEGHMGAGWRCSYESMHP